MNKKISAFSHGMKTSTYLAIAMSRDADIFIFDEPTWGLDPLRRDEVLEMIRNLSLNGKTVLYTSHIIPEVEIADVFFDNVQRRNSLLRRNEDWTIGLLFTLCL